MSKSKGFLPILIPSATVFISSACIMIIELVASRLIARHLGSSLYTWTAVIGVVLAGITVGNYLGGRIADKFKARKALSVIFILSSVACVAVVILNNLVGDWIWLWHFSWPARVFSHVSLVFFGPAVLLGTISPIVAKMALDRGLSTGRTVGDIYAWGAAGSIFGTFIAGFYLIPAIGTISIIWSVGAVLLVMGVLYWVRLWPGYLWLTIFVCALIITTSSNTWAKNISSILKLKKPTDATVLYEDETPYCYVAVRQLSQQPDRREFMQDKLRHSEIIMDDLDDLKYSYEQIHAAITHRLSKKKDKLSVLVIGGGGYVFPRYIEKNWPGSRVDVAEIDPGVTKAATEAFGLSQNTSINTIQMDARNHVDKLLQNKSCNLKYDFIYEDALNDYSVPFQLTTKEFNDKLSILLGNDGVYMVELIDVFDSGLFLGAFTNTLKQTFPYVYVMTTADLPKSVRRTFVVVAAKHELDVKNLNTEYDKKNLDLWLLNDSDMAELEQKSNGIILTDNYAPVENFIAPVVRRSAREVLANKFRNDAKRAKKDGDFEKALYFYEKMLATDPTTAIEAYNNISILLVQQKQPQKAIETFKKALAYNKTSDFKSNMANIHFSLGVTLKQLGRTKEASKEFKNAVSEYQKFLAKEPDSIQTLIRLGDALASDGNFDEAAVYFQKAVNVNPAIISNQIKLIQALEISGKLEDAIKTADKAQKFFLANRQENIAQKLKQYSDTLKAKNTHR